MRIIYLGNNWVGWQLLRILRDHGEDLVGLVVHPINKAKYREEILHCAALPPERVFDASHLREGPVREAIRPLKPDIAVCGCFGYIIRPDFVQVFPKGAINSHIQY